MVDWKRETIEDLRRYEYHKLCLINIPAKVQALDEQMQAIRCGISETEPVSGTGNNRAEDRYLSCIAEKEKLKHNYQAIARQVKIMDTALAQLNDQERLVLERFYMNRPPRHVERLMEELGYEKSQVYRLKDNALKSLTISIYGIIDW